MWTGYNTPKVDVTGCVSSVECVICEISKSKITFVNVLLPIKF